MNDVTCFTGFEEAGHQGRAGGSHGQPEALISFLCSSEQKKKRPERYVMLKYIPLWSTYEEISDRRLPSSALLTQWTVYIKSFIQQKQITRDDDKKYISSTN